MTSRGKKFGFLTAKFLVLGFFLSNAVFAQDFCTAGSAIDGVPFFIGQTYYDVLNRAPDRSGQLLRIAALEGLHIAACKSANPTISAGNCEWYDNAQTMMDFLGSPESVARNGSLVDNRAFVTALYALLWRRSPDSVMLNLFVSLLDSGAPRLPVAAFFLFGTEYRQRFTCTLNGTANPTCNGTEFVDPAPSFVSQTFLDILNRPPDDGGQASWTAYLTTNQAAMCGNTSASDFSVCDRILEAQMTLSFLDSHEYQESNPPTTQNAAFVTTLYQHLLQRTPDEGGLQYWTNILNQNNDRVGLIYDFLTGNEYRGRFTCYAGVSAKLNFGINGHPFTGLAYSNSVGVDFATQINLVQNAGFKWYRVNVAAPVSGGDYSQMDLLLSTAQAGAIQLLPVIAPEVRRETDTLAELYSGSFSAAFNIVSRYKASIHVWELSNEEDVYSIYEHGDPYNGGTWPGGAPSGDVIADFYPPRLASSEAVLHGLADGVRAADPSSVRIIDFAWLHTGFIQAVEQEAIPYDIVGIHWYANANLTNFPQMGDITCPGQGLPCPPQPTNFNVIDRVQSLTNGKPIWLTENDYWPPVSSNSVSTNVSWQESYLPATLQTYLNSPSAYPYQMVMIYELLDEPYIQGDDFFSQMGLYQVSESSNGYVTLGAPKPAYQSVQQIVSGR